MRGETPDTGLAARSLCFDRVLHTVQAAIAGTGVMFGLYGLCAEHIRTGMLVRPFPFISRVPLTYHLVCRETIAGHVCVKAFTRWLLAEVAAMPTRIDG